jgi:hypothetical protein
MADKKLTAEDLNPESFGPSGGTSKSGGQNYNVGTLQYPASVGTDPAYQHYVGFFINIRGRSKYYKNEKKTEITGTAENRLDPNAMGKVANTANTVAGVAMGGTLAAKGLANIGKTGTTAKVAGLAAGAAVGAIAGNFFLPDTTYRIASSIMLAVAERPSVSYGVQYAQKEMGTLAGALQGGSSAVDVSAMGLAGESARALLLNTAQIPSQIAGAMGASNFDQKAMSSKGTGTTMNPFKEQLFESVSARDFKFTYKFLPRSAQEAANVQKIIQMFKFHMHPELSTGGLFYIYPSEFNIVYYYAGKANKSVHKISTCVLEHMNVDYGGQQFSSFKDGSPTEVSLSLSFKELETLTKERILAGY